MSNASDYDMLSTDKDEKPQLIGDHFVIHTIEEILASTGEPPPWIIKDFMAERGSATISGRAKSFKSWAVMELAMCMCMGDEWLDMKTKQGAVVYVNLELSAPTLHFRVKKIAEAKNIDLTSLQRLFLPVTIDRSGLWADHVALTGPDGMDKGAYCRGIMDQVVRAVEKSMIKAPQLVILDSFYNLAGGINENDAADVASVYAAIRKMREDLGSGSLLVHHFSKGNPADKMAGERGAGSRVHRQEPDTYAELTPHEEDGAVVFNADLRDYKPLKQFCLRWNIPLLERDDSLNPDKIKRPPKKGRPPTVSPKELLELLPESGLSGKEWWVLAEMELEVSRATYHRLRERLLNSGKVISKGEIFRLGKGAKND